MHQIAFATSIIHARHKPPNPVNLRRENDTENVAFTPYLTGY